ncbi:MAG TPA: DUF1553 domain-containing protein [Cyclobacteriaceae bacterium]|nr:DUF1553 domain-containing protein [Cyclobacteriaceae bacterium]
MNSTRIIIATIIVVAIGAGFYYFPRTEPVDFNTQVKPILNKKCITCHGGVKREAEFSLLFRQEAMAKAESGKFAIVPGDAGNSELIRRISSHDPEFRMPYKKDPLTNEEISTLKQWIEEGAEWGDHWAYQSVKQQVAPATTDWTKNDIDRFILEKLTENDLAPSSEADKETLLRRVSLDLIGMPADENLRKEFLSSQDPKAYEVLVDSLLASKRFGERWTAVWLDLARYSDTKGYERDYIRSIWRYRDWLIDAFNRDMPYDSFLIEQLAGDLLPNPTDKQYLATAFHRNTMTNDEGGTDNEEFRTAAVIDRVNTTWESLMGTTFACVQCHSHPYDPFRHEEYYKFMAFFNNSRDEDTYDDYPVLRHLDDEAKAKLTDVQDWVSKEVSPEKANEIYTFVKTWQPAINSIQSDEFVNAALTDTKWLIFRNHAKARMKNVTLTNRDKLIYRFIGYNKGGVWTIRTGSHDGKVIAKVNVPKTEDKWTINEISITPAEGVHDLYFSYENPNIKNVDDSGIIFDWFYFTDSSIPWDARNKKVFWELLTKDFPSTPVMMENPAELRRTTQVFERGNWLVKGDTMQADVPASLLDMPEGAPKNRLGLAMWVTSKENPLVARTIVNRVWEQIYGMGLVETLEDFGTQGIPPTHPELLDHLSWKLMNDHQWSLKALMREIVMSATYRQDSKVTEDHLAKDQLNKFYARAPRVRLTAEQIRDQALSVSGLLSTKMYGPGSMPYQPDGIWLSPYNGQKWKKGKDGEQYRRAVYTYWKRTAPYPSMMTFDGSARELCTARRIRTNTPLQALVTLNDSVYVEAAGNLAKRMIASAPGTKEQIKNGFAFAMGHEASEQELGVLMKLHEKVSGRSTIRKVSTSSKGFAGQAGKFELENEAMTIVASAIMNLDEFVTKD